MSVGSDVDAGYGAGTDGMVYGMVTVCRNLSQVDIICPNYRLQMSGGDRAAADRGPHQTTPRGAEPIVKLEMSKYFHRIEQLSLAAGTKQICRNSFITKRS